MTLTQPTNDDSLSSSEKRLAAISKCTDEIEWCRNNGKKEPSLINIVGELDWISELHRLLHDNEK